MHIRKNIENLNEIKFKTAFGFLYDGYSKRKYYWEFIILYRKMFMIFISVFMVTLSVNVQVI